MYKEFKKFIINYKKKICPIISLNKSYYPFKKVNIKENFWIEIFSHAYEGKSCWKKIFNKMNKDKCSLFIGSYLDLRNDIYIRNKKFIHLGIDIIYSPGTFIKAPIEGKVYKIINQRNNKGDYGIVIILEHKIKKFIFYSLYGHIKPLANINVGKKINRGDIFCFISNEKENGFWPPHIHFQILSSLLIKKNIFFGVIENNSKKNFFLKNCPNPIYLTGILKFYDKNI